MERLGGCQCGAIRYGLSGPVLETYVCHCRECRKQSASAFGISLEVLSRDLRVIRGEPAFWSRDTDSGGRLACAFCPACGSRLWHQRPEGSVTLTVKGGSLDEPPDIAAAVHIWTSRKLPGVTIPEGARHFPGEPDLQQDDDRPERPLG